MFDVVDAILVSDHLGFSGEALPVTMGLIDDWTARNRLVP